MKVYHTFFFCSNLNYHPDIVLASNGFVYTKPILRCKMLVGKPQTLELHRSDAGFAFCKTLFQYSAGVRRHHGIVMITGFGTASQQANEHSEILILCVNLAFVCTKALLAAVAFVKNGTTQHCLQLLRSAFELSNRFAVAILGLSKIFGKVSQ